MQIEKTQFYTTNAEQILNNLLNYLPKNCKIIEPFVGKGDLIPYIEKITKDYEIYDIASNLCPSTDTLLNPPVYKGNYVLTNPPYMAKNKSKDKAVYDKFNLDDLYKISIKTMIDGDVEGGILIIPANFIMDEYTSKLREEFFSKYKILHINYFTYPIFDDTSYSIIAFYFEKTNSYDKTILDIYTKENVKRKEIMLNGRLFEDFYNKFNNIKPIIGRVVPNNVNEATNIKVYCLDNRLSKIRAEYDENVFIGKSTDRVFFTMTRPKNRFLTIEEQKDIIERFNLLINNWRNEYENLIFTTYRENNRKRIGFDLAYKILTGIIENKYNI